MFTQKCMTLCTIVLMVAGQLFAQADKALLRDLAQENKQSVEALALYPEDTRLSILEAAKYPEVLIKMQNIREKTSAAFRTLIEDYPRNTQEIFYDLTRFPGLTEDLEAHQNDRQALRKDLEVLPDNKRSETLVVVERHMRTISRINTLNTTTQNAFTALIAGYPAPAQEAFRDLLLLPEVVDILNEDLRFTVLVGDIYKEDPAWVIQKVDSLNLAVARSQAQELEEWKKTIENDPQAQEELQAAAREYADEYGYTDEVYGIVQDDLYAEDAPVSSTVVERYYYYSYPYWFGYPWWAPQPYWRPYPYWWYWGYYPYYNSVVIIHFPSYHFMHWYFYHPHHHRVYNHLSTRMVNHYYGHRNSGTTITAGVQNWRDQNRNLVSDEWLRDRNQTSRRLREFATFEEGRQKYNTKNPTRAMTQEEYLNRNQRKYPDLVRSRTQAQTEIRQERMETDRQRSDWAPAKEPLRTEPAPARQPRTDKPEQPKTQPNQPPRVTPKKEQPKQPETTPRPQRPARQPANPPVIDRAKDYHRDKWEAPRKTPTRTQPAPAPKTKTTPAPRRQPAKPQAPKTQPKKPDQKKRGG
ncbi:MAG: hypothetical protein EP344_09920 [Bacteroidetes bacterium]|nr:MAG: hypothetical protein EP344_09920 [Bacteroidota bacterium]